MKFNSYSEMDYLDIKYLIEYLSRNNWKIIIKQMEISKNEKE
jgi:hypothetical protein